MALIEVSTKLRARAFVGNELTARASKAVNPQYDPYPTVYRRRKVCASRGLAGSMLFFTKQEGLHVDIPGVVFLGMSVETRSLRMITRDGVQKGVRGRAHITMAD